jgi:hypothetical protein
MAILVHQCIDLHQNKLGGSLRLMGLLFPALLGSQFELIWRARQLPTSSTQQLRHLIVLTNVQLFIIACIAHAGIIG